MTRHYRPSTSHLIGTVFKPAAVNLKQLALMIMALTFSSPSEACRESQQPSERLASAHHKGIFDAIALVRVQQATYLREQGEDAHPWRATATVERILKGSYYPSDVQFERGWGSSACDDGQTIPKAGDLWVVYFWHRPDQKMVVWISYPAAVASLADPQINISDITRNRP